MFKDTIPVDPILIVKGETLFDEVFTYVTNTLFELNRMVFLFLE